MNIDSIDLRSIVGYSVVVVTSLALLIHPVFKSKGYDLGSRLIQIIGSLGLCWLVIVVGQDHLLSEASSGTLRILGWVAHLTAGAMLGVGISFIVFLLQKNKDRL